MLRSSLMVRLVMLGALLAVSGCKSKEYECAPEDCATFGPMGPELVRLDGAFEGAGPGLAATLGLFVRSQAPGSEA
jgi:hypothetical protein